MSGILLHRPILILFLSVFVPDYFAIHISEQFSKKFIIQRLTPLNSHILLLLLHLLRYHLINKDLRSQLKKHHQQLTILLLPRILNHLLQLFPRLLLKIGQ